MSKKLKYGLTSGLTAGILFATVACAIWGTIFIVPEVLMPSFSAFEIALGRYLFYGVLSSLFFFKNFFQNSFHYPISIWKKALLFSLISSTGYYTFVVLSLRYSSPAICALILGISPIAIAFFGNWKKKETSYRSLVLPSLLILLGLLIINVPHLKKSETPSLFLLGIFFSFLALASWTWFVVANSDFLKRHKEVRSDDWSTMLGVTTLFWALFFSIFLSLAEQLRPDAYHTSDGAFQKFLLGCAFLGGVCSWFGAYLWNRASLSLPVSLAGQLTILETIFGLIYYYLWQQKLPTFTDLLGIVILIAAVLFGIRQFSRYRQPIEPYS